MISQLHTQ